MNAEYAPSASPGDLSGLLHAATAAWERKDFPTCIEALQHASRLAPSNCDILVQLGRIHGLRYDYAAAESCFEKALRLAPGKTALLTNIGTHCRNFRDQTLAERYLRRALEQADATPLACIKLAELYERLRRLPEAADLVAKALHLQPAHPAALLARARLDRLAGNLEPAEQQLRSLLGRAIQDPWIHAQAWYELATVLDRQEKFDDAMAALLAAKSLLKPHAPPYLAESQKMRARLKAIESGISSEMFRHWSANGPALTPPRRLALLCGYVRSGTTLLEQVLDSHPDIVSAEETTVFLDDALPPLRRDSPPDSGLLPVLDTASNPSLEKSRTAYFRSLELSLGHPIAGRLPLDKNPALTYLIPGFLRVFPETKFLIVLRDPRDVVLSCFLQTQPLSPATVANLTLTGAIEDYTSHLSLWRKLAPSLPVPHLEVRYEDMVADLESVARQTLAFLGLTWDPRVLGFARHAREKMVRSPTYADVTQPVYQRARGRWRHYQKHLEPHLEKLEPFVKAFGYD